MQIPRLHPDTIEQVKQRADIVDVISEYVILRKRGKDFVGLCPFHEEKSPSFTVSSLKQMYYCFGCQAGGNVIKFLMDLGKRSFSETVFDLAHRYQVPIQTLQPEERQELQRQISLREQLYEILALAANFYQHLLRQKEGQLALDYLYSQRRLSEETIQKFQLGYAVSGWETLYGYLVKDKNLPTQLVEKAGLILPRKSGDGYYDRFRDRLMIPIHDIQGRVIGFGGRSLGDEQPKYLNSPETELFDKGKTLFALDQARKAIIQQDQAIVVEGYFDAIALHAAGINHVVASLGTALSLNQVKQLLRYTESKQIILNFDADQAGTNAASRAISEIASLAYQGQVQLKVLNLPGGKDADEFLKTVGDATKYQELIDTAPLWINWQIDQLLVGKDLRQADQYQQVSEAMVKLLNNITNDNQLSHYINYCAEILSQSNSARIPLLTDNLIDQVIQHWQKLINQDSSIQAPLLVQNRNKRAFARKKTTNSKSNLPISSERDLLEQTEALLLRIFLHCPEYQQQIIESVNDLNEKDVDFTQSHHQFLWNQIELQLSLGQDLQQADLISKLQDSLLEFSQEMSLVSHLFYLDEKTQHDILRPHLAIRAAVARLEKVACEKARRSCLQKWSDPETNPKDKEFYYQEFCNLQVRIKELEQLVQFSITELYQVS